MAGKSLMTKIDEVTGGMNRDYIKPVAKANAGAKAMQVVNDFTGADSEEDATNASSPAYANLPSSIRDTLTAGNSTFLVNQGPNPMWVVGNKIIPFPNDDTAKKYIDGLANLLAIDAIDDAPAQEQSLRAVNRNNAVADYEALKL